MLSTASRSISTWTCDIPSSFELGRYSNIHPHKKCIFIKYNLISTHIDISIRIYNVMYAEHLHTSDREGDKTDTMFKAFVNECVHI